MVSNKRYMPTNKRFQDHTKMFVGTKTKKGHLGEDKDKEKSLTDGILVRIVKKKIKENGWEVKVGKDTDAKTYMCTYGDNIMYLPDCTETDLYYVPKEECSVQVNIDEKTKTYMITRINSLNKTPIEMTDNELKISTTSISEEGVKTTSDVVVSTDLKDISLTDVGEQVEKVGTQVEEVDNKVEDIKTNGLETKGDIIIEVDSSTVSLIETNDKIDAIYKNGIGSLNINNKVSVSELYTKVTELERRIQQLEQNNG